MRCCISLISVALEVLCDLPMLKFSLRRKLPQALKPAVCMAHRDSIVEVPGDNSPFVRKDVFQEYAKRMDERCGKHEDLIRELSRKVEKTNQLLVGLIVSMLLAGVSFVLNLLLRLI